MKHSSKPMTLGNNIPIKYVLRIAEDFQIFADESGISPRLLCRMTVLGILNQHVNAVRKPGYPNVEVFQLAVGGPKNTIVYYTVDCKTITVRGYGWDIDREPLDDQDGGFFIAPAWS